MKRALQFFSLAAVIGLILAAAGAVSADHSWGGQPGNHWRRTGSTVAPTVVNKTPSATFYNLPAAVQEWNDLSGNTYVKPVYVTGTKGQVEVQAKGISIFYLGLAQIQVRDGHIVKGKVTLNTFYANSYTPAEWDSVLCQELGHIWGLDHNPTGVTGGTPDDTCMNSDGWVSSPNSHDAEELDLKYAHVDPSGGGPGGGNGRNGDEGGEWITIHGVPARR